MTVAAKNAAEFWVFGYGSLMWRPGFPYDRCELARLAGYHRAFCVYSTNHRGNDARPGLVLGLDRGGVCDGVAFRVAPEHVAATRRYLAAREQINGIYREKRVAVTLAGGARATVFARTYIVERAHPSYAGRRSLAAQAQVIRSARGRSGLNFDYLINTLCELQRMGVCERELQRLGVLAGAVFMRAGSDRGAVGAVAATDAASSRPAVRALRNLIWRQLSPAQSIPRWQRRRFVHRRVLAVW